jgi:uncharacterized protein YjcR
MKYCNKFYHLSRRKAAKILSQAVYLADIDPRAKEREKKILFYRKHRFKTIQEAYGVKCSTLLKWQKEYGKLGIYWLVEDDNCPERKQQSQIR